MSKAEQNKTQRHAKQKRVTYLQRQLAETHNDMDRAREVNSWTAVATLRRQALSLRAELDEMKAAEDAMKIAEHRLTDDEIVDELRAAISVLPVSVVEELMEACEDRVGAPRLALVKGD